MMLDTVVKVFVPALASFALGIALTPFLTHYLYKWKAWKKKSGRTDFAGNAATVFNEIHKDKAVGTPRMGGIVIWGSVALTTLGISLIAFLTNSTAFTKLEFLSRNQTWLPFFTLLVGAVVGLFDDYLEIRPTLDRFSSGLSLSIRLILVSCVALFVGWWFYDKLDVVAVGIPFSDDLYLGWLIVPLFVLITLLIYAGGVIDGIDGLAGGVFAAIFTAYASIAFNQGQFDLSAFSAAIAGGLLAFLWFNIPPARFYMTETGSMALTLTLVVVAFMTDTLGEGKGLSALFIIALPLIVTAASSFIQVVSKKYRGKKIFRVAPLHHHFEAIGWPPYKVVMRYWIISLMCAVLGMTLAAIS
jgi:phospho-N-acetylmuramoyl-pentapeptide-transferase